MPIPYSELTEEQKEARREANRRWSEKNDRSEYYREYDRKHREQRYARRKADQDQNPEKYQAYSKRQYYKWKGDPSKTYNKQEYKLWWAAKKRANKSGIEFNLDREDIIVPDICPCCTKLMNRPSLDRVNNNLGYLKTNAVVICYRCNTNKGTGDAQDHRMIAEYIERHS